MNNQDTVTLRELASPFFWFTAILFVLLVFNSAFDHRIADPVTADGSAEEHTEEKSLVTE